MWTRPGSSNKKAMLVAVNLAACLLSTGFAAVPSSDLCSPKAACGSAEVANRCALGCAEHRTPGITVRFVAAQLPGLIFSPKVVLKNADEPFIDLSGSVGDALGNGAEAYAAAHPSEREEEMASAGDLAPGEASEESAVLELVVRDETIEVGDTLVQDPAVLGEMIASGRLGDKRILLVDDYAEARTFHAVIRILEEQGVEHEYERR